MSNRILAISGYKKSGKDTVADYLVKEHSFTRQSFAGPLKDLVVAQYNIDRASLDDQNLKEQPLLQYPVDPKDTFNEHIFNILFGEFRYADGTSPQDPDNFDNRQYYLDHVRYTPDVLYWTPRALAILEGSVKRSVNSSYWVQTVVDIIKSTKLDDYKKFVISDLRYKSEVEQLKAAFGKDLVTIRINRFDSSPSSDASERDLDNYEFDQVVENKGTLEELYSKVNKLI